MVAGVGWFLRLTVIYIAQELTEGAMLKGYWLEYLGASLLVVAGVMLAEPKV